MIEKPKPPINWAGIAVQVFAILIPIAIALIVWGSKVERRLSLLEAERIHYAGQSNVEVIANDLSWIKQQIIEVQLKQNTIINALNDHMREHRE